MFEPKNKEEALKYIVHITYNKNSEGSGLIVPVQGKDYSYVLTVKHTFGKDDDERGDKYYNIQTNNIEKNKMLLTTSSKVEFTVLDVFFLENEPKLDFLIIQIENNSYINDLKKLDIYEEDFNYCLPYGFPESSKDGHTTYEPFNCEYKPIVSDDKLEIRIMDYMNVKANKGTNSYMSGISGAGVFVENKSKDTIYLVGIVIQGTEEIKQNLVCLDLEKLSKKINDSLLKKGWELLNISGAEWKNKFGFDMSDLDFKKEIEEFKEKSKNKFIKALKDEENFVDTFDNKVKSNLKKEEEKFQKISESYLYIGMNFHQLQSHKRATHYLNKAIEYGGNKNKSYLLDAKSEREEKKTLAQKTEQEKELLLGLINTLYQGMYEYEEQLESNPNDETLKKRLIECYKELSEKLNFFDDRNEEILDIHTKSIKLYADFDEYDNIQEQIFELKDMIDLGQKFEGMKTQVNDYKKEIERLNKQVKILSTMDKKLDVITTTIKKTNNRKLDSLVENIYNSNRALVSKIQTMYHQNDRVNRIANESLEKSIKNITENLNQTIYPVTESSKDESKYMDKVRNIIEKSNEHFYKEIQGLFEKETTTYNEKLLEVSIASTQKENALHIENLEEKVSYRDNKISLYQDEIKSLEDAIDSLSLDYQNSETKSIKQDRELQELNLTYKKFKETIKNNKTNDLTEVEKLMYEDEIEKLKISIGQLKGKNEQIAELKDSIELSSKTANTLINLEQENRDKLENYIVKIEQKYYELDSKKKNLLEENFSEILKDINSSIDTPSPELLDKEAFEDIYLALEKLDTKLDDMEDNYELKVDKLNERFTKLISNPKNEKRLRRISKQVKGFEQKLEKVRLGQDSTITLSLIESDLNKIEKIMRKHKRISIYQTYCVARQVLLGVVLMMSIIALFINEPYSEFIKEFSLSSIVKFLK